MSEVAHLELKVTSDGVEVAEKRLKGMTKASTEADKSAEELAQKVKEVAAAYLSFEVIKSATAKIIEETRAYDGLISRLHGVTSGAAGAQVAFSTLEEISDSTIFTENQMVEAFLRLRQTGLDPSERSLRAFSDIASGTGKSLEDLTEMTLSASMGVYRGLKDLGVKAVADGDKVRVTYQGVTQTIGNSAASIQRYLVALGEKNFAGAASAQLDTMGGSVKKLEDAWGDLFRDVGRSDVGSLIRSGMEAATTAVNGITSILTGSAVQDAITKAKQLNVALWSLLTNESGAVTAEKMRRAALDNTPSEEEARAFAEIARRRKLGEKGIITGSVEDIASQYKPLGAAGASDKNMISPQKLEAEKAKREKIVKDLAAFERTMRGDRSDEVRKELESYEQAQGERITAIRESLQTEMETMKLAHEDRMRIIEENATDEERAVLMAREGVRYEDEIKKKKGEVLDPYRDELALFAEAEQRKLDALRDARDQELITEREYAAAKIKIDAEVAAKRDAYMQASADSASAMFGNLATVTKNFGGEQSGVYKTMFAAQKSFAVASATLAMFQDIAKAYEAGPIAGIPLAIKAAAEGAAILAQISSTNYSGAYDKGGFIPAGKWGIAGEYGPEVVNGPATVTSREDTARMMGSQAINLRIVNAPDHAAAASYLTSSAGEQLIMNVVKRNATTVRAMVAR